MTGFFNTSSDYPGLFRTIASVLNVNVSRFEMDTTLLTKATGDTTVKNFNLSTYNLRKKYTNTPYTPPSASGTIVSFLVFREVYPSDSPSNQQLVNMISYSLADIKAACKKLLLFFYFRCGNGHSGYRILC